MVELARRVGVSRQLVYLHFENLEQLAVEIARTFREHVVEAIEAGVEKHPDHFAAAIRETLTIYFLGLEDERLVFTDLLVGHWAPSSLAPVLKQLRAEYRKKMIDIWTRHYQRVADLGPADARALSSFKHDSLGGLIGMVNRGQLGAEEAIEFFIDVVDGAIQHFRRKAGDRSSDDSRR